MKITNPIQKYPQLRHGHNAALEVVVIVCGILALCLVIGFMQNRDLQAKLEETKSELKRPVKGSCTISISPVESTSFPCSGLRGYSFKTKEIL